MITYLYAGFGDAGGLGGACVRARVWRLILLALPLPATPSPSPSPSFLPAQPITALQEQDQGRSHRGEFTTRTVPGFCGCRGLDVSLLAERMPFRSATPQHSMTAARVPVVFFCADSIQVKVPEARYW